MPAPYALTEIWERITASMPADHFSPGNAPVLAQLCRHIAASDKIAMLIEMITKKKPFNPDHFATMLRSQVAESVVINRLARSMRLTQQAVYRGELVRNRPIGDVHDQPHVAQIRRLAVLALNRQHRRGRRGSSVDIRGDLEDVLAPKASTSC